MRKNIFTIISIFLIIAIALIPEGASAQATLVQATGIGKAVSSYLTDQVIKLWLMGTLHQAHVFFDSIYRNLPTLIVANPTIESISPGLRFFLNLVMPFYILGIGLTGIYFLFLSGSPAGRSMAKGNLLKLICSLILISLSPLLLKLLFFISSSTTGYIMSLVHIGTAIDILERATDGFYDIILKLFGIWIGSEGAGGFFAGVLTITYYVLYIIILGRFIFVTLFAMLLPLTMFLYSFYSTRGLGKTLLRQLLFVTFVQIIWGITLAVIAIAVPSIYSHLPIPDIVVSLSAYFIFWFSPMVVLGIMDWFSVAVLIIDATTTGPLCVGPVVMDELYAGREIVPEEVTAPEYM